jgi:hypothetical protein
MRGNLPARILHGPLLADPPPSPDYGGQGRSPLVEMMQTGLSASHCRLLLREAVKGAESPD